MLNAKANQFSLSPEGEILWQSKPENPLPGAPVARILKGEHVLRPVVEVLDNDLTKDVDRAELKNNLTLWLNTHIGSVLEPLVFLGVQGSADPDDPVQAICKALYDSLGIVPREELEDFISKLDNEQRAVVRSKKIKLGPLLIFIPLLNKPAAVRLRGLLWSIHREKSLPAPVPADGIVSMVIDEETADRDFYRAVGYPIYGGRAVRIDMLDRVINSIYDQAEKGKFSAKHQMAEWLGCSIDSLYKILESMGHTKIHDPAEEAAKQTAQTSEQSGPTEPEVSPETSSSNSAETSDKVKDAPQEKPELAVFRLKRGKAFEKRDPNAKRRQFSKGPRGEEGGESSSYRKANKDGRSLDKSSDEKSSRKSKKGRNKDFRRKDYDRDDEREARVISFEVKRKEEDSPFAILQKLKAKGDE